MYGEKKLNYGNLLFGLHGTLFLTGNQCQS